MLPPDPGYPRPEDPLTIPMPRQTTVRDTKGYELFWIDGVLPLPLGSTVSLDIEHTFEVIGIHFTPPSTISPQS